LSRTKKSRSAKRDTSDVTPTAAGDAGHTIRVVSELTSIPIDTLRVWERRYGFPRPPRRVGSNRRLYSQADVERLQHVAKALEAGFRPGDVILKSVEELRGLTSSPGVLAEPVPASSASPDRVLELLRSDDLGGVEAELRHAAAWMGPRRFLTELAQPLIVAVGEAWARGELHVRQEHVLSQAMTTQLRGMLAPFQDLRGRPVVLLTTLPGEPHALGLEMVALYLALSGARPRLLGPSTPPHEIVEAVRAHQIDVVGLTVTHGAPKEQTRRHLAALVGELPRKVHLWLGGTAALDFASGQDAMMPVTNWTELDAAIESFRSQSAAH
jgi:MerR family transcriptional regulator, light-induced transcriptional regulator